MEMIQTRINPYRSTMTLDDKVLDLARFQLRPKITGEHLKAFYDSFIQHVEEIGDHFEDTAAFEHACDAAANDKQPMLVAREPRYPMFHFFHYLYPSIDDLVPKLSKDSDKYFWMPSCTMRISVMVNKDVKHKLPLDKSSADAILDKMAKYPGYEGLIEIPNDLAVPLAKYITYHEAVHYLVERYQSETSRHLENTVLKEELKPSDIMIAKTLWSEGTTLWMVNKLLTHDPDALFELRWPFYYAANFGVLHIGSFQSTVATGAIIALSLFHPYLFPLVFVPGTINHFVREEYKKANREKILAPVEYPRFKI